MSHFLFLFFELRPFFRERHRALTEESRGDLERYYEEIFKIKDKRARNKAVWDYIRLEEPILISHLIDITAMILTSLLSIQSLLWLIQCGFDQSFTQTSSNVKAFLWGAFLTTPIYYVTAWLVLLYRNAKLRYAAKRMSNRGQSNSIRSEGTSDHPGKPDSQDSSG
jgi:hypothetical protein